MPSGPSWVKGLGLSKHKDKAVAFGIQGSRPVARPRASWCSEGCTLDSSKAWWEGWMLVVPSTSS